MALKWGIASAGRISHDFVNALGTLNEKDHEIVAVAAQDLGRANEFATRFGIQKTYDNYLELATDPDIEVVYIGTINTKHFEVAKLMLENNKHVLVEKPLCMNENQARDLISFAKNKNLFLMEAIWSRFFPSYQYIREQIHKGVLGEISSVDVEFGFENLLSVERLAKKELGGGTILDLGVYVIQLCQWVFKKEPKSITATGKLSEGGIDLEMIAEMKYDDDKVGKVKTSAIQNFSNTAKIVGTKGEITLPMFWAPPTIIDVNGTEKSWPLPAAKYDFNFINSCGLRYEAEEVRRCIRGGELESDSVSHNDSLLIARIEDEIRKQIGVRYLEDDD